MSEDNKSNKNKNPKIEDILLSLRDIDLTTYTNFVKTIESNNYHVIMRRLAKIEPGENTVNTPVIRLMHGIMGLVTEAGEMMEPLKKHIFYGKTIDVKNMREELGDLMWYLTVAIDALDEYNHMYAVTGDERATVIDFNSIMIDNVQKLAKRYPSGTFTEADAINRDTENELSHIPNGAKADENNNVPDNAAVNLAAIDVSIDTQDTN